MDWIAHMQEMHRFLQVATKLAAQRVSLVLSWKMTNIWMVVTIRNWNAVIHTLGYSW